MHLQGLKQLDNSNEFLLLLLQQVKVDVKRVSCRIPQVKEGIRRIPRCEEVANQIPRVLLQENPEVGDEVVNKSGAQQMDFAEDWSQKWISLENSLKLPRLTTRDKG